jgi:hypothetical protein
MNFPQRYQLWNYIFLERLATLDAQDGFVLLTVNPRLLAVALSEANEARCGPDEAERDLIDAVREAYQQLVRSRLNISVFKSRPNGEPASPAYLALSVLAAYNMHRDNDRTARAYYPRFAKLLGVGLDRNNYPLGFDGPSFIQLWEDLSQWLKQTYGRTLTPPVESRARHYVVYPLAHVPLRQVDVERLPRFFATHGYTPGSRPPLDKLAYDLVQRQGPWSEFTGAGKAALQDLGRQPLVVRQVAHELEYWDGLRLDTYGRRVATIEVLMDVRRRRAHLSLLARRPINFPGRFEDDEFAFEAADEGWYDPVPLEPGHGDLLARGFRVSAAGDGGGLVLERPSATVIPFTPSADHTGHISDRVLRLGAECAVLCQEAKQEEVSRFLRIISDVDCRPRRDPTLPGGWCLFTSVTPMRAAEPPKGLDMLRVEYSIKIVPQGGLRIGRTWSWLHGASPRLQVMGARSNDCDNVKLDGVDVELGNDGNVPTEMIVENGSHLVEVGRQLRQQIVIVEPVVHPDCAQWSVPALSLDDTPLPLPQGAWILIGERPGELFFVTIPQRCGEVVVEFSNVWAVRMGLQRATTHVLHLRATKFAKSSQLPNSHGSPRQVRARLSWAETIHQAAIRRPSIAPAMLVLEADPKAAWNALVIMARLVKRELRGKRS